MKPYIGITCDYDSGEQRYSVYPGNPALILRASYVEAIEQAGGIPVLLPVSAQLKIIDAYVDMIQGVLIPGSSSDLDPSCYGELPLPRLGPGNPLRADFELTITRKAFAKGRAILGICGGMQVLNVAFGGTLYQDIASQLPEAIKHQQAAPGWYATHAVHIESGSRLQEICGGTSYRVNSFHHQAVKHVAEGFLVTARAEDGIIEGIERPGNGFVLGVQWHPERMYQRDQGARRLFEAFVQAAKLQPVRT
ncbi:MAG: gamma-glutamyl-gamma-aminobutyrate hydrolase family protein [Nitrospinota bacterium]|nr:MAG: gamma-glutamyl-gamma-aminobutyrate hydrolase family protein [Nitrospinota bacterium]